MSEKKDKINHDEKVKSILLKKKLSNLVEARTGGETSSESSTEPITKENIFGCYDSFF